MKVIFNASFSAFAQAITYVFGHNFLRFLSLLHTYQRCKSRVGVIESRKRLVSFFLAYWTALLNAFRKKPSLGTPDIRFRHISSTDKEVLGHYLNPQTIHDKSSSSWISSPLIPWKYHVLLINYYFIHIIDKNNMSRSRLDWFYTAKKGKPLEINHLKKCTLKPKPINVEVFIRRTKLYFGSTKIK